MRGGDLDLLSVRDDLLRGDRDEMGSELVVDRLDEEVGEAPLRDGADVEAVGEVEVVVVVARGRQAIVWPPTVIVPVGLLATAAEADARSTSATRGLS